MSFLKNHGKVSFYNSFFDYTTFITGNPDLKGSLDMISETNCSEDFIHLYVGWMSISPK